MIFAWDFTENFFRPLGKFGGLFMLLLGVMWIIYAIYETKRRKSFKKRKVEDWDFNITKFLKALTYLGFLVGILSIMSGLSGAFFDVPPSLAYQQTTEIGRNWFTSILFIIIGLLTFVKPANDLPLASIIGVLVASVLVVLLALMIPQQVSDLIGVFVNPKIVLLVVFVIIFAIVALTAKFYTAGIMTLSKALSWPPLGIIFAIFCLIQGALLLVVGISISGYF